MNEVRERERRVGVWLKIKLENKCGKKKIKKKNEMKKKTVRPNSALVSLSFYFCLIIN